MGAGIYIENCKDIVINNFAAINCSVAVHAENTQLLQIDGLSATGCAKGIVLNECWDSDLKNLNIETNGFKKNTKEKLLSQYVRYFMYN